MLLPALDLARSLRGFAVVLVCGSALCLAGCDDPGGDPRAQIGPNPVLPEPTQYLMPPMHVAKVVPWKKDETPTVPRGLKIQALATGLGTPLVRLQCYEGITASEALYEAVMRIVLCPTLHEHDREVSLLDRLMHGTTDHGPTSLFTWVSRYVVTPPISSRPSTDAARRSWPPTRSRRSISVTSCPARAAISAALRPAGPAPTTTTRFGLAACFSVPIPSSSS